MKKIFCILLLYIIPYFVHSQTVQEITTQANQAFAAEDYETALGLYRHGILIASDTGNPAMQSQNLVGAGMSAKALNRFEDSIGYLTRAAEILKAYHQIEGYLYILNELGFLHFELDQIDKAYEISEEGMYLSENLGKKDMQHNFCIRLWVIAEKRGLSDKACDFLSSAMKIAESAGRNIQKAEYYIGTASGYMQLQRYDEAIEMYVQSGESYKKANRLDSYAVQMIEAGRVAFLQDAYVQAEKYFSLALSVYEKFSFKPGIAQTLNELGGVYGEWGEFDRAVSAFEEALDIAESVNDQNLVALLRNNLAGVYFKWGQYEKALEYFVLILPKGRTSEELKTKITILNNIGMCHLYLGEFEQSAGYFTEALLFAENVGDKILQAGTLSSLGGVQMGQKKYEEAAGYFNRSLALHMEMNDQAGVADALNNIGSVFDAQNMPDRAYEYFEHSLLINEKLGRNPRIALNLTNIGKTYFDRNQYLRAGEYLEAAIDIFEKLRMTASGAVRRDYFESMIGTYRLLIFTHLRNNNASAAVAAIEQSKARYLAEKIQGLDDQVVLPTVGETIRENLSKNEAVVYYVIQEALKTLLTIVVTSENIEFFETDLKDFVDSVYDEFQREIELSLRGGRGVKLTGRRKPTGDRSVQSIFTFYRSLLRLPVVPKSRQEQLNTISSSLYALLIEPFQTEIEHKSDLIIIPDGILGLIPFETLKPEGGTYLIKEYGITYVHSMNVLNTLVTRDEPEGNREIIAFGGADYATGQSENNELDGPFGTENSVRLSDTEIINAVSRGGRALARVYDRMKIEWPDLPGTLAEVTGIKDIYPLSTVITGKQVNETFISELSVTGELKKYKVLHFSTHGLAVPEYPELSALVLSRPREVSDENDGYLSMYEITDLDLDAEFVNLSACKTGLGKIYYGEGIVGLSQAFLIAGARGISVSLWQVADESTKEFMVGMYRLVREEELSYSEAMRKMKLKFINGKYCNPFYWAPFVYYGVSAP